MREQSKNRLTCHNQQIKRFFLYPEPGSNRHGHYWPQDFKSGVSTDSTIRAQSFAERRRQKYENIYSSLPLSGRQKDSSRDIVAGSLYLFSAKRYPKIPGRCLAYSVPSNVRNGRLFAGLQANRPRFLPLLAGTSFHGSGIGPGSFAAKGGAGVRRLFYGCLHRTGSQYPAVAPESGFKPLYAFCRAGFSSRDIGKLSTFHF